MDKTLLFLLGIAILIIGIGFVVGAKSEGAKTNEELFRSYISKYLSASATLDNYKITSIQNINGEKKTLIVEKTGNKYYVELKTPYYSWILVKEKKPKLCLRVGLYTACTQNFTMSISAKVAGTLEKVVIGPSFAKRQMKWFSTLLDANAIRINKVEKEDNCTAFYFEYSYKNLTLSQLQGIGYSPGSPAVSLVDRYYNMVCIDDYGIMRKKSSNYIFKGRNITEAFEISEIKELNRLDSVNGVVDDAYFATLASRLQKLVSFLNSNNMSDLSIRSMAAEVKVPQLCELSKDKLTCADAYMTVTGDPRVCDILEGRDRDNCYLKAGKTMDIYFCNFIEDKAIKDDCLSQ